MRACALAGSTMRAATAAAHSILEIRHVCTKSLLLNSVPLNDPLHKMGTVAKPAKRTAKRKSRWMDGFSIGDPAPRGAPLPATPVALRAP